MPLWAFHGPPSTALCGSAELELTPGRPSSEGAVSSIAETLKASKLGSFEECLPGVRGTLEPKHSNTLVGVLIARKLVRKLDG